MADRSQLNLLDQQIQRWLDQERRDGGLSRDEKRKVDALRKDRAAEAARVEAAEGREREERAAERVAKEKATAAKAEADKAEAAAKVAAETARVETERVKAETEANRLKAEAQKRKDDAAKAEVERAEAARQQVVKTTLNVAFPVVGAYAGHKIAANVTAKDVASIKARAANLADLAKDVEKQIKGLDKLKGAAKTAAKKGLAGSVAAADKLQLTRTKGPMAAVIAGMLVAEGAFSRLVAAPQVDNPIAKEALQQASSASLFAATTLLGERALARATPIAGPAAKDLASIEKARALTAPAKSVAGNIEKRALQLTAPPKKGAVPAGGGGLLGKLFAGAAVVTAVAAIVQSARAEGTSGALKTAAKMVDPTGLVAKYDQPAEPSIRDLAREQAAARDGGRLEPIPNTVTAHIADDVRTGLTPAGQGQLMARVANAGLDNFYAGPRPAEFERRADALAMAGVAAREVNSRPETRPQMQAVPQPPPAPSAHEPPKPRHVWDDYARERAAEARRNKGL